jgi:hypothetical protein
MDKVAQEATSIVSIATPSGMNSSCKSDMSMGAQQSTASFPYQNQKITILQCPKEVDDGKYLIRSLSIKSEIFLKVGLEMMDTHEKFEASVLLDSGATGLFMSPAFTEMNRLNTRKLDRAIPVQNVDGTTNQGGSVTHKVDLIMSFKGHKERATSDICDLGNIDAIIRTPWLRKHNPEINWTTGEVEFTRCPRLCGHRRRQEKKHIPWEKAERHEFMMYLEGHEQEQHFAEWWHRHKMEYELACEQQNIAMLDKETIPAQFQKYRDVFDKEESEQMPLRKPYDHAIELKEGFTPKKVHLIHLSPEERGEVEEFIQDQLRKGYIRPSKSPHTSPVFFIPKKDRKKRMVQDYREINKSTIWNNYPLPLISELIDQAGQSKVFTKIDLRWGYNNMRIKEGDEWKAVFATHIGAYEPLVMYFGLMNSPASFQNMMNDILKDLIADGKVIVYIDDILIHTVTIEGHDDIVEEVLDILQHNDLFAKPKKCFWKVEEVEFLRVILSKEGVHMDPSKVQAITDWPTPEKVRDVQAFLGLANFY